MGIGGNLKLILERKNISVAKLARLTEIPSTTLYSMIKRDGFSEKIETLEKIVGVLDGVELSDLYQDRLIIVKKKNLSPEDLEEIKREEMEQELFSDLTFALEHAPRDNDKREKEYIERLARIIRVYGEMSQHMHIMALTSSKEKPEEYIRLLQNYEKLQDLIKEHKDDIINGALDWLDDDSKLRALIYGDDPEYKK
ncbi:Uncharacterised protein [Acetobacterium wieringae]|uniref:helix-turn-helix domain-containing protein n=1 Tax=Acetobacterium wieringae TaxID=52694 RepID=UPI001DC38458|nr:helix-turn-helix transcriptional regulator [Acetobacterium wieringae]VUZ26578.1 Uncharacterised protein [Acetobacterium wieringae]